MRAWLLQAFYCIRAERQLVEPIDTNLLFRWFVGLGIEDAVWDATTFTKNRDRVLGGTVAGPFLASVLSQAGAVDARSRSISDKNVGEDLLRDRDLGNQALGRSGYIPRPEPLHFTSLLCLMRS